MSMRRCRCWRRCSPNILTIREWCTTSFIPAITPGWRRKDWRQRNITARSRVECAGIHVVRIFPVQSAHRRRVGGYAGHKVLSAGPVKRGQRRNIIPLALGPGAGVLRLFNLLPPQLHRLVAGPVPYLLEAAHRDSPMSHGAARRSGWSKRDETGRSGRRWASAAWSPSRG